jgi:hypothetical protein
MPEGNQVLSVYDQNNNILLLTKVAKPGSGLANIVNAFTYDPTWNKVKTVVDGNNNTTTMNYDPATGNLLSIVEPPVDGQTPQVVLTYNSRGQVATRTDETSILKQFNYDGATEKLLSTVVDFGSSPHLNLTTNFGYSMLEKIYVDDGLPWRNSRILQTVTYIMQQSAADAQNFDYPGGWAEGYAQSFAHYGYSASIPADSSLFPTTNGVYANGYFTCSQGWALTIITGGAQPPSPATSLPPAMGDGTCDAAVQDWYPLVLGH